MNLYAILADPIAQVKSPALFNARAAERGIESIMVPMRVDLASLARALDGLSAIANFRGAIVSIPLKAAAAELCHTLTPQAASAGVVNVLRKTEAGWQGASFDGEGLVAALRAQGHDPRDRSCLVVGAGGAGAAIATALLDSKASRVEVEDIAPQKAHALVGRLRPAFGDRILPRTDLRAYDIVVNATPMGMKQGDPLPVDVATLDAAQVVADIVMEPSRTRLIETVASLGKAVVQGDETLAGQFDSLWAFLEPSHG